MQYGSMNIHDVTDVKVEHSNLPGGSRTQDIHITTSDGEVFRLTCFLNEKFTEQQEPS